MVMAVEVLGAVGIGGGSEWKLPTYLLIYLPIWQKGYLVARISSSHFFKKESLFRLSLRTRAILIHHRLSQIDIDHPRCLLILLNSHQPSRIQIHQIYTTKIDNFEKPKEFDLEIAGTASSHREFKHEYLLSWRCKFDLIIQSTLHQISASAQTSIVKFLRSGVRSPFKDSISTI